MAEYYIYILASRPGGAIYVGVTNISFAACTTTRAARWTCFTKKYGINKLVYYEQYDDIRDALQREKNMKHWPRAWKTRLIVQQNPSWRDLYNEIAAGGA